MANESVTLTGWVHRKRTHGGVIFIILRDSTGTIQVAGNRKVLGESFEGMQQVTLESSIQVTGKIVVDIERCKGCGLCVVVCPKNCIVIAKRSNKIGYFPAEADNADCTGCASCAIICPEAIIKVFQEDKIVAIEPNRTNKSSLVKEKG